MTEKKKAHVSKAKIKNVSELAELIKSKKTILIASIKSIRASQYQELVKRLRNKAIVKVPKKNIIIKAIDTSGNDAVKKLKTYIKENYALLFSDEDSFELAAELISRKTMVKAKPGQIAPENIEVSAGPTDLVPGPAISELGALGIQIQIDKGKINIKEPKVIVRKGEKISQAAADVMGKLDIKPFSVGFLPVAALDMREGKIYVDIKIDREETIKEIKNIFGRALPFAVSIGYATGETIKFLIGKAGAYEKAIDKLIKSEDNPHETSQEINTQQNIQEE